MADDHRIVRLDRKLVSQTTIIVRCRGCFRLRTRFAFWLMRVAGKVGGFKSVKMVREKTVV